MRANAGQQGAATVLLSGGIDSSACVAFLLDQAFRVESLFIDYGQAAAPQERAAAAAMASHFGVPLRQVRLSEVRPKAAGIIPGRNAFLVLAAVMESDRPLIAIGVHSGTAYWDCSPDFVEKMQAVLDGYTDGRVRLLAPFATWTKREIWDFCLSKHVPIQLTYSCESGGERPCGHCLSCRDLEALRAGKKLHHPA